MLVTAYNVTANNKTGPPRAVYTLYIGLSNSNIGHIVFILSTKSIVTTPKYKPKTMAEDIITMINTFLRKEGMPNGI